MDTPATTPLTEEMLEKKMRTSVIAEVRAVLAAWGVEETPDTATRAITELQASLARGDNLSPEAIGRRLRSEHDQLNAWALLSMNTLHSRLGQAHYPRASVSGPVVPKEVPPRRFSREEVLTVLRAKKAEYHDGNNRHDPVYLELITIFERMD